MALELGDPPSVDGDPIVTQSDVNKWKRRSLFLTVVSFLIGQILPHCIYLFEVDFHRIGCGPRIEQVDKITESNRKYKQYQYFTKAA